MNKRTYFEVQHGMGGVIGKDNNFSFETESLAIEMAKEFKANPRSHNKNMEDSSVEYWQNQTFTIVQKTIETRVLTTI